MSHFLDSRVIIVSGAGIAGLTLAIAISHHFSDLSPSSSSSSSSSKPRVIIYERDSYEARIGREGYSLSLRTDNNPGGIQVLDFLGLYRRIRAVSVNSGDSAGQRGGFNVWDRNLHSLLRFAVPGPGPNQLLGMRIRRNALQKTLAEAALDAGAEIHWETAVTGAQKTDDGKMQVDLSDGSSNLCDLLIAADGSRSKLRALLRPSDGLDYTSVYIWGGTARYPSREAIPKPVDRDWGTVLGGGGIGLFMSPVDDKSVLWALSRASTEQVEPLRPPLPPKQFEELMDEARSLTANFHPLVRDLMSATDPSTVLRFSAVDRPAFPNQPFDHGPVIWVGDANHAVSPFAGNGANLAIMDAWDLASALRKEATLDDAIAVYDKAAVPRAKRVLTTSRWSIDLAHATGLKLLCYRIFIGVMAFFNRPTSIT